MTFISFSCFIVLARTSETILVRSGESGNPCFASSLRGKAVNTSPLRMRLAVGFLRMPFIEMRKFRAENFVCFLY